LNEKDHIGHCLRSVFAQDLPIGEFEVLVVDGCSDDGTYEIVQEFASRHPEVRLVTNPARIVSTGLNIAIREARGQVILRMDAHTEYASDYIRECLAVLREKGADNVGGPAATKSSGFVQSAICAAYHSSFSVGGACFHNVNYEGYADTVPYGCWPRQVFERIGMFDEQLVRNQDDEFNLRLIRAGGKIWQSPKIKSWYKPRPSLKSLFEQYKQYGYWKVRVLQKHKTPASMRHLVPGVFVGSLVTLTALVAFWDTAALLWASLVVAYVCLSLTASVMTARHAGWCLVLLLPIVFGCYHFGYGWGFLRGFLDFVILRRKPNLQFTTLTRLSIHDLKAKR
jgi:glycosyltransferase involved in cell wall biosynthesis